MAFLRVSASPWPVEAWLFVVALIALAFSGSALAQGRGGQAPAPPQTARSRAPIDLTGNWVAIISEDWRWRMITPSKGDFPSIPLNLEGQKIAEAWDPARDEAAGEACRAYGAPGLMRGPTRLRISWLDDNTMKLETDYGMQTRLFRFAPPAGRGAPNESRGGGGAQAQGARTWQGATRAEWMLAGGGRGRGAQAYGALKTVTTNLRPGYLRKNGVPYSDRAVFTEYWDIIARGSGDRWLVNTNIVDDPVYLQLPWTTAIHFKKEPDGNTWNPEPCDARF
ncbi:MAG: hypothetical protein HY824_13760 [Acidobacteria bacterium]|nr:hypothetical protein [Acidobacteriota bacterium]